MSFDDLLSVIYESKSQNAELTAQKYVTKQPKHMEHHGMRQKLRGLNTKEMQYLEDLESQQHTVVKLSIIYERNAFSKTGFYFRRRDCR